MEKRVLFKSMAVAALALPMVLVSCKEDKKSSSSKSIAVDSVALNIHDTTIFVGDNVQFSYTIFPNDATNKDVEWSGDEEILIISNSGQVAGKAAGTGYVFITTVSGEHKDSCLVKVIKDIEFKDKALLNALVKDKSVNTDGDEGISLSEASNVTTLKIADKGISSFDEIGYFKNLETLTISDNQLTSLDVTSLSKLTTLRCQNNKISKLDISQNAALTTLLCNDNNLDTLDIRNNDKLEGLYCGNQSVEGMKLQLTIDQFNSVWKENGTDEDNKSVELVMNFFEGATFHSSAFSNDLKDGDSTSFKLNKGTFTFRLYGANGNELSFYDPSVLKQIKWSSSDEKVASVTANFESEGDDNKAQMEVEALAKGNATITGTVNDEYTISFNLEVK